MTQALEVSTVRSVKTVRNIIPTLSLESVQLVHGIARRMDPKGAEGIPQRLTLLNETLFRTMESTGKYDVSPEDVWEILKNQLHLGPSNEFDTYERKNPRFGKYPPVGVCACRRVEVSYTRTTKIGVRRGQWRPELGKGCKYHPVFSCSKCIRKEYAIARSNRDRLRPFYPYSRALSDSEKLNSPKTKKHLQKVARRNRIVIRRVVKKLFRRSR